jgi:hypothetical protein
VEAAAMCQRALAGDEKVLGPDHQSTLESVCNLGQDKLEEAVTMYQQRSQ